jgi:probable HAF family extracellular repeat protein
LGQIVGDFSNSTGGHGFLDTGGSFTQIDVPGATDTTAFGINDTGQIVGAFFDSAGVAHGFLDAGGNFTQIDVLGATRTDAYGINDAGQIVGRFFPTPSSSPDGFLATPVSAVPEPSTLALLGIGVIGLGIMRRRAIHAR